MSNWIYPQKNIRYQEKKRELPDGTVETEYRFQKVLRKYILFGQKKWYDTATVSNFQFGLNYTKSM